MIIAELAARCRLRENHIELIIQRAIPDDVEEAAVGVVDQNARARRSTCIYSRAHAGKMLVLTQPEIAVDVVAQAIAYLHGLGFKQRHLRPSAARELRALQGAPRSSASQQTQQSP